VKNVTTAWILVNKGASSISEALCTEHIPALAAQNPKASNIKFAAIDDREAILRGLNKRDVYCKFTMDIPKQEPIADAECGILGVEREGCVDLTSEFAVNCVNSPNTTNEELWKKAGCLVDVYQQAPRIKDLDKSTYEKAKFLLSMMEESLGRSKDASDRRLSRFIESEVE
jgi:hypothetical protein